MEMRDEDLAELHQPHRGAEELALSSLGAVEEEPLAAAPNEERGRGPPGGGHRAGGAEEDDVEIHGAILGLGPQVILDTSRYAP